MLFSMTGYGKASVQIGQKKVVVEIRSLNSKQLDLSVRMSSLYKEKDNEIRQIVARRVERGKVELNIFTEADSSVVASEINAELLAAYYQKIRRHSTELDIPMPNDLWGVLLRMPNVFQADSTQLNDDEWKLIEETLHLAIDRFIDFRRQEGSMLESFFLEKLDSIEDLLLQVEPYETERIERIKLRLYDALDKLTVKEFDQNRFEQELIYYLEKLDITEEKTRLSNHCHYFRETLDEDSCGKGKKLGFILQEMGREINTLGSKSNQAEMQRIVVCMKDGLEQMKEQVLNVL